MKPLLGLMILTTGLCGELSADSIQAAELKGQIGWSVMEFGNKEFSNSGHLLDREDGLLQGIKAALHRTQNHWLAAVEVSYYAGQARYDGQTASGAPLNTHSHEILLDLALHTGRWYKFRKDFDWGVYGGMGYHQWRRDIQSTGNVTGPFEVYDWWYGFLGTKGVFYKTGKLQGAIDLRLIRTMAPKITVDFKGLYDNVRLDLGERFGGRLSLPWRYHYQDETAFLFEPYLEGWDLGQSSTQPLTRNGAVMGSVLEPRSETRNYGFAISIIQSF